MTKQIMSGIDYGVHMINIMVAHNQAGAMPKWVNGMVKSSLVQLLALIEENQGNIKGIEKLTMDAQLLIVRAIRSIPQAEKRGIVLSTCLHYGIVFKYQIPVDELNNVTIIPVD